MDKKKKTLVLGASPKAERYSNRAVQLLRKHGHPVVAVALRESNIDVTPIVKPEAVEVSEEIDTITLYVGARHQKQYYDYLLKLEPNRIVFNPGSENEELAELAQKKGIETLEACTLVMLTSGTY